MEKQQRGPKPKGEKRKVPLRVWAQQCEVDKRGGREVVQVALTTEFYQIPVIKPYDPRTEVKEGEG